MALGRRRRVAMLAKTLSAAARVVAPLLVRDPNQFPVADMLALVQSNACRERHHPAVDFSAEPMWVVTALSQRTAALSLASRPSSHPPADAPSARAERLSARALRSSPLGAHHFLLRKLEPAAAETVASFSACVMLPAASSAPAAFETQLT